MTLSKDIKLRTQAPEVVIFDLDKTFFRKNTSFEFYFYLLKEGVVSKSTLVHAFILYFQFSCGFLSLARLQYKIFQRVLKGLTLKTLEDAADRFLALSVDRLLRVSLLKHFQDAKKRGAIVCLLSASPGFLVHKIAALHMFDRSQGTEYLVDKEGRLCEIASRMSGPEKKQCAMMWVEKIGSTPNMVTAYSDSHEDLPLLEWVGIPVAVSPNRPLKRIAELRKWIIL